MTILNYCTRSLLKICFSVLTLLMFSNSVISQQTDHIVDHRYSIPWWQTLVCMPDDPVKTLVGKEGQFFGEYGYKNGPRDFSSSVMFDNVQPATWVSQHLLAAAVPITETIKKSGSIEIREHAFVEIPTPEKMYSIVRFDSRKVLRNWTHPAIKAADCFTDAAFGETGLSGEGIIELHIKVPIGASNSLSLGFCEGKYTKPGQRRMRVQVEGDASKEVDPVADFGPAVPGVYNFDAKDVNKDGNLIVVISNLPGAIDRDVFLNGLWLFSGAAPDVKEIVKGTRNKDAIVYAKAADIGMPQRRNHILVHLTNTGNNTQQFQPVLRIVSVDKLHKVGSAIQLDEFSQIKTSVALNEPIMDSAGHYTVKLAPQSLAAGAEKDIDVSINRFYPGNDSYASNVALAKNKESEAVSWWKKNSPSAAAISVPDQGIQDMVISSLRNIFQARDIRKGEKSFHVGPTIYRGLWIADGSFILEVATMLNYIKDVRSCIDYLSNFQLKDGGFEMIKTFHKENGLVPFMLIRHAMLTQDKTWLRENWKTVEGCIRRINYLRSLTLQDSTKPNYGLLPEGNVDGGIQHGNDYSNTEWCLSGMKWAINGAKWLGNTQQAADWQKQYDAFFKSWEDKARKDIRKDEKGNTYLPVMIDNEQNHEAQRGQWAFAQSVYPGQIFDDNPEVHKWAEETVDMLTDHRVEGLVISTGWMTDGLWTYFSSFYAHAMQWLGKTAGIPQLLYDFANHASPTMVWREEQMPVGKGNKEVGDMPHNWASAEFIRMVVHMIEIDRGKELHLFEALPKNWVKAGEVTALNKIRTPFGQINLKFEVNEAGDKGKLTLDFLDKENLPIKVVVHKDTWSKEGKIVELPVSQHIQKEFSIQ